MKAPWVEVSGTERGSPGVTVERAVWWSAGSGVQSGRASHHCNCPSLPCPGHRFLLWGKLRHWSFHIHFSPASGAWWWVPRWSRAPGPSFQSRGGVPRVLGGPAVRAVASRIHSRRAGGLRSPREVRSTSLLGKSALWCEAPRLPPRRPLVPQSVSGWTRRHHPSPVTSVVVGTT